MRLHFRARALRPVCLLERWPRLARHVAVLWQVAGDGGRKFKRNGSQPSPVNQPHVAYTMIHGVARSTQHRFTLPAEPWRDVAELSLEISVAPPPTLRAGHPPADAIVLYVLDPEPVLFGAAALHCYAGCGYFASGRGPEAAFHRLYVVGIGHEASSFSAGPTGWDSSALRNLRRRDFPPLTHPALTPGCARVPNPSAQRLATALGETVFPHVETEILGLAAAPQHRVLLGSSYTAVLALQVLLHAPDAVDAFILGSPSVPFDPEIMNWLEKGKPRSADAPRAGAFIAVGALEREETPPGDVSQPPPKGGARLTTVAANVHRSIPDMAHALANLLRARGVEVDGAHEVEREDHTSLKLTLVSQGVSWLLKWVARHHGTAQGRFRPPTPFVGRAQQGGTEGQAEPAAEPAAESAAGAIDGKGEVAATSMPVQAEAAARID